MKSWRQRVAVVLSITAFLQSAPAIHACGLENVEPIFVFADSPDPPFQEFTRGNIGILKPSFGRKTLTIAYRYLNGGSFDSQEQQALIEALKGLGPEPDDDTALKAWIAARKLVIGEDGELPEIYRQSKYGSYDFFPNCSSNAFEVAVETLKDRVNRFGSDDVNVHEWLQGQDLVFRNCSDASSELPQPAGADRPAWLQKDRDYQIAAANFYALHFDEARRRFEQIAEDGESDWQETADYLVARTLVRKASLNGNESTQRPLYETAETHLLNLLPRTNKFRNATKRLLGLVKYRLRPEERAVELSQVLADQIGNENLRQDLIDYVWLLDKFEQQIQKAEEERKKLLNPPAEPEPQVRKPEVNKEYEAVQRGELIDIWFAPRTANGQPDYDAGQHFYFKPGATATEILQTIEAAFGRKLSADEIKAISESQEQALLWRKWGLSPNRKWSSDTYDGCYDHCNDIPLDLFPSFLRNDSLSDWIFTFQSTDPAASAHALARWRQSQSPAWFVAALAKSNKTSPSIRLLLAHAEKIQPDMPMYPTVLYHRIRLDVELGKQVEARRLLDDLIAGQFQSLPLSAQNEFAELRMELAQNLTEFLKFATRKPAAFYQYGTIGTINDILKLEKEMAAEQQEPVDQNTQNYFDELRTWDERVVFDEKTCELLNWHFPVATLLQAAHDPSLPDYLRQRMLLVSWTRAVLLKDEQVARTAASEIVDKFPQAASLFQSYLNAKTATEARDDATYILLKWQGLSPYISHGIPESRASEEIDYYFETSWWCTLSETDYDDAGNEQPKRVATPHFLAEAALAQAQKERATLIALGDAKQLLGKRVLEWANKRKDDPRLPEALFIAAKANESYKYGCGSWERDDELRGQLGDILLERYGSSPWAAKLNEDNR